ncbi:MAG: DUF429 domain-containing protein [Rhizobiaceae bacterium]
MDERCLIGVDGCKAGWIAVSAKSYKFSDLKVQLFPDFQTLARSFPPASLIAVDMPIGLPEFIGKGGRGPETLIRPLLGERQSSVFSIPSHAAVYTHGYRDACHVALETSNPPRKVSKQAFHLFPKIRQLDEFLLANGHENFFEVHPELAFWKLNDEYPLQTPKKIKGRLNPAGMKERKNLLAAIGIDRTFLNQKPPRGAAFDDLLDACACLSVVERISQGRARSYPEKIISDDRGLPIAIWA